MPHHLKIKSIASRSRTRPVTCRQILWKFIQNFELSQ